ncbi:MAG: hypothetical protein ABFC71_10140 [Methanoregula sp.]
MSRKTAATAPFTCPKCDHTEEKFQNTCPACGRPYVRDYIDTQMHPRDPNPRELLLDRSCATFIIAREWVQ